MPLVSVLMVFHRDTPYLRPAIASVLGQTWRDLELVLVDNGTGLAPEALGDLGRDERLRWVRLPRNEGIPAGHNAGVAAARGRFLALLDHDDVALPRRLERQVAFLQANPTVGLVSSLAETIDEQGRVVGREFALTAPDAQRAYAPFAAPVVTPAYTGRREVFERLPYRPEYPFAGDFDFLTRAAEAWPMAGVPEVLLQYRRHGEQTTQARATEIEFSRGAIRLQAARRHRGEPELAACPAMPPDCGAPADAALFWAGESLRRALPVLAAFQARRALALRPFAPAAFTTGLKAVWSAAAADRALARRMFFKGPVRALGLTPA